MKESMEFPRTVLIVLGGVIAVAGAMFLLYQGGGDELFPGNNRAGTDESGEGPVDDRFRTGEGVMDTVNTTPVLQHTPSDFRQNMMSGGPPPDGIPSIDDPTFIDAGEAELEDGDIVIGMHHRGAVRAYPQDILAHHEIVNQELGGGNVAVTYCPLTGTAQGFNTGTTTLGVSGKLVNSNLVMYDRDTGSLFPQIAAAGIDGELQGNGLDEFNVHWTTWGNWKEKYPETTVLSRDTGFARNYDSDPYGSYNPRGGYYESDNVIFPLMHQDDTYHPKDIVVGGRTPENAVYVPRSELRDEKIIETASFVAVYDSQLDTGYIYERGEEALELSYDGGEVIVEGTGESYAPGDLPLDAVVPVEAFYFAWNAFYPKSERL